ncbi:hypothetical protein GCM10027074_48920 [Streptomyces deserti]
MSPVPANGRRTGAGERGRGVLEDEDPHEEDPHTTDDPHSRPASAITTRIAFTIRTHEDPHPQDPHRGGRHRGSHPQRDPTPEETPEETPKRPRKETTADRQRRETDS